MSDEEKELWVLIPGSRALYATRAEAESFLNGRASRDAEVDALQAELERGPVTPTVDASDLERRIREAKAEAWDEGFGAYGAYLARAGTGTSYATTMAGAVTWLPRNPYRSGTTTEGTSQ
jgi:hypothetical protein